MDAISFYFPNANIVAVDANKSEADVWKAIQAGLDGAGIKPQVEVAGFDSGGHNKKNLALFSFLGGTSSRRNSAAQKSFRQDRPWRWDDCAGSTPAPSG